MGKANGLKCKNEYWDPGYRKSRIWSTDLVSFKGNADDEKDADAETDVCQALSKRINGNNLNI